MRLVSDLRRGGWDVRCLVRDASKARALGGAELAIGDVTDPASLRGIAYGVDVVFHLAAIGDVNASGGRALRSYRRVNVEGTKNVLAECEGLRLKKFVHFSSVAAMGRPKKAGTMDERDRCRPVTPYEISKRESELAVLDAWRRKRVPAVVIRPVMVSGRGERKESKKLETSVRMRAVPIIGDGSSMIHSVHVDDVVRAAVAAASRGRPGQAYILCGSSETWNDAVDNLAKRRNIRITKMHVPLPIARHAVALAERAFNAAGIVPIFTTERLERLGCRAGYDCSKARKELVFRARKNEK